MPREPVMFPHMCFNPRHYVTVLLSSATQDAVQSKPVLLVISLSGIKVCSQTGEVRPHAATVGKLNMLVHVHVRDRTTAQIFASRYGWFIHYQIVHCYRKYRSYVFVISLLQTLLRHCSLCAKCVSANVILGHAHSCPSRALD